MLDFGPPKDLPTVLLIDDDLVSREVMATVLTMSGYTVHTAANGAASLQLLAGGECVPGVILMDAQMPGPQPGPHLCHQRQQRAQRDDRSRRRIPAQAVYRPCPA
jgi:CheY-like chemotaxis protein